MTIVLIGAPGAGKSTVGARLAAELGLDFVDVDELIEQRAGKSISEIFADEGETYFRELECHASLEAVAAGGVVSLGGGAVMTPRVRQVLEGHDVVWLEVSIPQASRRVGLNTARPLLVGNIRGRLIELLRERTPVYEASCTTRILTDDRSIDEIVTELAQTRR